MVVVVVMEGMEGMVFTLALGSDLEVTTGVYLPFEKWLDVLLPFSGRCCCRLWSGGNVLIGLTVAVFTVLLLSSGRGCDWVR